MTRRELTGQDWPCPTDILLAISEAIAAHDAENPRRPFPVEARSVIRRAIRAAVTEHTGETA